jgi:hypothetical protein
VLGVACVAVPVRTTHGEVVASIAVQGATARLPLMRAIEFVPRCRRRPWISDPHSDRRTCMELTLEEHSNSTGCLFQQQPRVQARAAPVRERERHVLLEPARRQRFWTAAPGCSRRRPATAGPKSRRRSARSCVRSITRRRSCAATPARSRSRTRSRPDAEGPQAHFLLQLRIRGRRHRDQDRARLSSGSQRRRSAPISCRASAPITA